ncbi:flagellar biosynthesis protein FlhB [Bradyrhizobium sp. S3.14.4]
MIAGGTLVVSTFSGSVGSGLVTPMRNLLANSWMIKTDGRALLALMQQIEVAVLAAIGVPLLMLVLAAIAGNVLQHRLVWSGRPNP